MHTHTPTKFFYYTSVRLYSFSSLTEKKTNANSYISDRKPQIKQRGMVTWKNKVKGKSSGYDNSVKATRASQHTWPSSVWQSDCLSVNLPITPTHQHCSMCRPQKQTDLAVKYWHETPEGSNHSEADCHQTPSSLFIKAFLNSVLLTNTGSGWHMSFCQANT